MYYAEMTARTEQHELEMIREALREFKKGLALPTVDLAEGAVAIRAVLVTLDQAIARHATDEMNLLRFLLRMRGAASRELAGTMDSSKPTWVETTPEEQGRLRGRAEAYEAVMMYLLDGDLSLHRAIIGIVWAAYLTEASTIFASTVYDNTSTIIMRAEQKLRNDVKDGDMNFWELR